ncbi:MAG: PAS domain S-box protein, partial [bacterium]
MMEKPDVKILVVEDERIVAMEVCELLRSMGYEVIATVPSGEEAILEVERVRPDLVLMDIQLKGAIDGIGAAEQIRSCSDIPVIYMTAYADQNTLQRAKITDPFGYLLKPFNEKELHTTIEMALNKSKIEKRLKESEKKYRLFFNRVADPVFIFDKKNHQFLDCNEAAIRVYGYSMDELKAMTPFDLHPPEDLVRVKKQINQKNTDESFTYTHLTKDGRKIFVEIRTDAIEYDSRPAWISIVRDITERKLAEDLIRKQKISFEALFASAPDAIASLNMNYEIVSINPQFEALFGYSLDEVRGKCIDKVIVPKDKLAEAKEVNESVV